MIKLLNLLVVFYLFCVGCESKNEKTYKSTIVIVHGAWGGGWAFKKVDSLLTAKGHNVYRPTLTGQGERVHLANKDISLDTHISDVVNTILFEELDNIILVGHSYGGMVVTGVANQVSDRIKHLVYLDAVVPENGESAISIMGALGQSTDGFIIPSWVQAAQHPPMDVPHPAKTWSDDIQIEKSNLEQLPTSYILTVEKGQSPEEDGFYDQAERARQKGWPVLHLTADHNAQWSAPNELAAMLIGI
ncbi:MAG: alpha/beta hydrolase [Reichenbachiella sp.]